MVRKDANSSIRHAMLAVILLVAGTSSAAFGHETSSNGAPQTIARGSCGIRLWLARVSEGLEKMQERAYV